MIFFLRVTYEKSRASLNMIKKESKDFLRATFEKFRATFEKFTCAQLILFMTQTATHSRHPNKEAALNCMRRYCDAVTVICDAK